MLRSCPIRAARASVSAPSRATCRKYSTAPMRKTPLHAVHVKLGAKMAPFCGWDMPIEYPEGTLVSHMWTRQKAGLFDVSHMGQVIIRGPDRVKFIEGLVVSDIAELSANQTQLSVFTNEKGGIKDDTMITNAADHLYVVINAGCAEKDITHLTEQCQSIVAFALGKFKSSGGNASMEVISDKFALLALQGPSAAKVMQSLVKEQLNDFYFMHSRNLTVKDVGQCRTGRCGYTGEDGFEISVPVEKAEKLTNMLLSHPDVKAIGLGARDSLRLEAGLCLCGFLSLYGNDIDETTTPVEGSLVWTIGKRRREKGGFIGDKVVLPQIKGGSIKKRVGIALSNGIARPGTAEAPTTIHDAKGNRVGHVTSGTFSPVLKKGIAMAYVDSKVAAADPLSVRVRGKDIPASITKMPFVPQTYFRAPSKKV